jgi:hypothetical protein
VRFWREWGLTPCAKGFKERFKERVMSKKDQSRVIDDEDRGVYLVVDDGTDEFEITLLFAAHLAQANHGHLAILHMMEGADFIHWGGIASKMRNEARKNAEKRLWSAADKAHRLNGVYPALFLEEGSVKEIIPDIIERNPEIKRLILGGNTKTSSPGPLVTYFCGKGFSKLKIPVAIIPDDLDIDELISIV